MARKATRSKARSTSRTKSAATRSVPTGSPRERIIQAFMTLIPLRFWRPPHPFHRPFTSYFLL